MPTFPFDDEQKRRLMLTPGILSDTKLPLPARKPEVPARMPGMAAPSPFPETAVPERMPLQARTPGIAPGGMGMPPVKQPTRMEQLNEAKDVYLQGTPGRFKSGLLGALRGGIQGLASGGGLGGAIGGAVGGAGFGAINPRGQREMEFNERVRPKILEGFAFEDADRAARMAAAKSAGEQAMTQAQLRNIEDQVRSRGEADQLARVKDEREANRPLILNQGQVAVDPRTKEEVFKAPPAPKPPTRDELSVEPESGKSFEEIAEESYQARGGDQYVFSKLPERTQRLIAGKERNPDPQEVEAANRAFQQAIDRQRKADLDYTRGSVRSGALRSRQSGGAKSAPRKGQPGRRAISVSEAAELLK